MRNASLSDAEIAEMIGKTRQTVNHMSKKSPVQYELTALGALCKKLGVTEDDIEMIAKMKEQVATPPPNQPS